ncbi:hypothetical protein MNV49_003610 [Pseudohyphozyma bogoriensis]|nr:hypothetical protein MNV49_003610 [Pseudohyphozyma bogoriensis]
MPRYSHGTPPSSVARFYDSVKPGSELDDIRARWGRRLDAQELAHDVLQSYREEPLFDSEPEPESSEEEEKVPLMERLGAMLKPGASGFRAPRREARPAIDFPAVLAARRDGILAADRKRLEWRWHEHRIEEEDRIRREKLFHIAVSQGVENPNDVLDYAHGNFNRTWRGFELGVIGKDNTIADLPVIPSLSEILHPAIPQPTQSPVGLNTLTPWVHNRDDQPAADQDPSTSLEQARADLERLQLSRAHHEQLGPAQYGTERHVMRAQLDRLIAQKNEEIGRLYPS